MNQLSLLDDLPPPRQLARRTDPSTSDLAAHQVTACGTRARQAQTVLDAVRRWPGRTSRELAILADLDRHAVGRRLPDLERAGKVRRSNTRRCTASPLGGKAVTWELA